MYTHTHIHNTQGSQGFARLSVQTRVKSLLVSRTVSPAVVRRGCRGLTSNLAWIRGDVYSASNSSTRLLLDGSRASEGVASGMTINPQLRTFSKDDRNLTRLRKFGGGKLFARYCLFLPPFSRERFLGLSRWTAFG